MSDRPNRLVLPATLDCPFPPRLRLDPSDLGEWESLELLSAPASRIPQAIFAGLNSSSTECAEALAALKAGRVPGTGVPRVSGTAEQPAFYSSAGLAQALSALGFEYWPVLATKSAVPWLKANIGAAPLPIGWRTEVE